MTTATATAKATETATATEPRQLVRHSVDAYAKVLSSAGGRELEALMRQGSTASVCAAIYASPPYDLQVPSLPVSRLSVNLTRARVSGGLLGERPRDYQALRYSTFFVPAGAPAAWRKDAPSRHLNIYFHPAALDTGSDHDLGFDQTQPIFNAQIAGIGQIADQLAAELDNPDVLTTEAVDSLAWLLLVRMTRQLREPNAALPSLTPKALARLRDYVLAHLSERILVADLAREAGLSQNRFAQAFSEQVHQSPHQFVLGLRLAHAEHLLRSSRLSLVKLAHDCGFANQQHLSNAMRRRLGVTPGRYRRAHENDLG